MENMTIDELKRHIRKLKRYIKEWDELIKEGYPSGEFENELNRKMLKSFEEQLKSRGENYD